MVTYMKDENIIIGEWLTEKRTKKGLSQEEIAKKLGVSKAAVCRYEKGARALTATRFLEICKILDADPTELSGKII